MPSVPRQATALWSLQPAEEEIRAIRLSKPFSMIKIAIKAIERQNYCPSQNGSVPSVLHHFQCRKKCDSFSNMRWRERGLWFVALLSSKKITVVENLVETKTLTPILSLAEPSVPSELISSISTCFAPAAPGVVMVVVVVEVLTAVVFGLTWWMVRRCAWK